MNDLHELQDQVNELTEDKALGRGYKHTGMGPPGPGSTSTVSAAAHAGYGLSLEWKDEDARLVRITDQGMTSEVHPYDDIMSVAEDWINTFIEQETEEQRDADDEDEDYDEDED